jgi:large subunit ribosomal protein L25
MQILDLNVQKRERLGSAHSRRYCREGKIPCVLYGGKLESIPLVMEGEDFDAILKAHGAIVRLDLGGKRQTAVVRDVMWDTFGDYVQHIDLVRVELDEEIKIDVPMHFVGVPAGVSHGGVLQVIHQEVALLARVDSIPSEIVCDVSHLEVNDRVTVGDLTLPEHTRAAWPDNEPIAQLKEPRVAEEPTAEEAEAPEGEEGEAPADAGEAGESPSED